MNRFGIRALAAAAVATLTLIGFAGSPAGAANARARRPASTVSFVGNYVGHVTLDGAKPTRGKITINADGTAVDAHGNVAHWTSKGKTITINYSDSMITEQFVGRQSKHGIGTKKKPGTLTTSEGNGTWYAVKTS